MIFCAASNVGVQDIAFPYQCEIKINGGEVKANLRGLKNKPGSTRPVDITNLLRLKPSNYNNSLDFTYALTAKASRPASLAQDRAFLMLTPYTRFPQKFYLVLYICKTSTASELTSAIESRGRITTDSVRQECASACLCKPSAAVLLATRSLPSVANSRTVTRQAQDPDIVATSQVLSLKCPLTYMRLSLPIRSTTCKHIQCFDATSYLQLQEQGPQWLCPVCSRAAPFGTLAVDEYVTTSSERTAQHTMLTAARYVRDILAKTPSDQDQVTIDPNGTWRAEKPKSAEAPSTPKEAETSYINDEDELVFPFSARSTNGVRESEGRASTASVVAYRDATATPVHTGIKRQREVIDLTLSDDDDDAHPPPVKRQHIPSSGFSPIPYSAI